MAMAFLMIAGSTGAEAYAPAGTFCEPTGIGTAPCEPSFTETAGLAVDQATGDVLVIEPQEPSAGVYNGVLKRFKPNGEPDSFSALGTHVIDGQAGDDDETPQGEILSTEGFPAYEAQVAVAPPGAPGGTAGNIYVTDAFNGVVDVFDSTGAYLQQLTFVYPCGVAVAPSGEVFVGDFEEEAVHKLVPSTNPTPPPATTYSEPGAPFATTDPCNVAAGAEATAGFVFATQYAGKVTKIDSEGAEEGVTKYAVDEGENSSVAVDPGSGKVFTIESEISAEVQEYDASGSSAATETSSFTASANVQGLAIDEASGNVYASVGSQVEVFGALAPPTVKYSLDLSTTGDGFGSFKCDSGTGPKPCVNKYPEGTVVEVIPNAAPGSHFVEWSGDCTGSGTCEVTMSADKAVTARFDLTRFNLKVIKAGTSSGTVSGGSIAEPGTINCGATCENEYLQDAEVTLTATPIAGASFAGWSGGGCSGTASCSVTMSAAKEVTATFNVAEFNLTVVKLGSGSGTVSGGSIAEPGTIGCGGTCERKYIHDTEVTLTATPSEGSTFVGWSGAGCSGTGTCTVTMSAAKVVAAIFQAEPGSPSYTLTVNRVGPGSGSVSCNGGPCASSYPAGTTLTLAASPVAGSAFTGWAGAGCSGTAACTVTLNGDTAVTAAFETKSAPPTSQQAPGRATVPGSIPVKGNKAIVELSCEGDRSCAGVLKLFAKLPNGSALIGKSAFNLAAGDSKTIRVRIINRRALAILKTRGSLAARAKGPGVTPRGVKLHRS
jgi:Divergent InlB B-repeat domain